MPGYYDLVLGAIPFALFGVSGMLHLSGLEFTTAVPLAGLFAAGIMGHAMFINAPVSGPLPGSPASSSPVTSDRADSVVQAAD